MGGRGGGGGGGWGGLGKWVEGRFGRCCHVRHRRSTRHLIERIPHHLRRSLSSRLYSTRYSPPPPLIFQANKTSSSNQAVNAMLNQGLKGGKQSAAEKKKVAKRKN